MRVVCRLRPPRDGDNGREAPVPLVFTSNAVYTFESGPRHSAYGRFDSTLGPHATQDETFGACCGGLRPRWQLASRMRSVVFSGVASSA